MSSEVIRLTLIADKRQLRLMQLLGEGKSMGEAADLLSLEYNDIVSDELAMQLAVEFSQVFKQAIDHTCGAMSTDGATIH